MNQSVFYVDKTTDTFADVLLTYGVATLLDHLLRDNVGQRTVRVKDAGSVYAIELEEPIRESYLNIPWFCDLPFLKAWGKEPPDGWTANVVDYDAEWKRFNNYLEAYKQLPSEAKHSSAIPDEHPGLAAIQMMRPHTNWDVLSQIPPMYAISAYTNGLKGWFESRACFPDLLKILLDLFTNTPNNIDKASSAWTSLKKKYELDTAHDAATPVQIVNPSMGKGFNRPKADGATRLDNLDSFWPLEYLKFWGMFQASLPRLIKNSKDRKTYVLRPKNISLDTLKKVFKKLKLIKRYTSIKMDVLMAIRYTDVFLKQWLAGQLDDVRYGQQPGDHISGLDVAYYKKMGRASSVLNLAEISVPQWMVIESEEQAQEYRALLEEHRRVVDSLNEGRGEEYSLLQLYRDFLSGRVLRPFFEFNAGYASLTMSRLERGQWAPRFSTNYMEVIIMTTDEKLSPILEASGFQNIAAAIRRSTVTPQYFKSKGKKGPYDIRYGLGNDLLRQAAYPEQFVQSLSQFLHEYNRETAQVQERYKGKPPIRRATVTTEDIQQVVELIDTYGSQTVANLLVAFGYAREPRAQEQIEETIDQDE
jgi:hypothetical protein